MWSRKSFMEVIKSELSFKDGWTLDKQEKQRACGKGVLEQRQRWERTRAFWGPSCRPVCHELGVGGGKLRRE